MAVQGKDPGAGRPLRGVRPIGSPAARPPARPAPPPRRPPAAPARRDPPGPPLLPLVLIPAVLTLAVTLLRLIGEVRRWDPAYFNRVAGGGLSPLGIAWLVPFVGFYFGWRLQRAGLRPVSMARAAGWPLLALGVGWVVAAVAGRVLRTAWTGHIGIWAVVAVAVATAAFVAWPALGRPLLAYAWAARIPVALAMALAINRSWRTHYDAVPPSFPSMPLLKRWVVIGLVPQMTIWVAWTMVVGAAFGALGWHAASRRPR